MGVSLLGNQRQATIENSKREKIELFNTVLFFQDKMDHSSDQVSITTNHQAIEYCRKHEISPNQLLIKGAKIGSVEKMRIAWLAEADKFKKAFIKSAEHGNLSCSVWLTKLRERLFMEWQEDVYGNAMLRASYNGRIEIMIWLHEMDKITHYEGIFSEAAGFGEIDVMNLIISWGVDVDDEYAIDKAVRNREIKSIKALKKWGMLKSNYLLGSASVRGRPEMMSLAKEWGATNYGYAKRVAILNNKDKSIKLLAEWEREARAEL